VTLFKHLLGVFASRPSQVGDGFHIRRGLPLPGQDHLGPFLLLDYAGPTYYPPTGRPRGVDEHPHRGFETVPLVFQGQLEHRDSTGSSGTIGPGDVQWMTAAAGLVHEEKHEREFARRGGTLEMVQLWVNLPTKDKMAAPGYQTLLHAQIPTLPLPHGAGTLRIVAGEYGGQRGPAHTFTALNVFDMHLRAEAELVLPVPEGHPAGLFLRRGQVLLNHTTPATEAQLAVFGPAGTSIHLRAEQDTDLLVLSGEPINEALFSYGPFVMNSETELVQAVEDYQNGKMGHLTR